MVNPIVKEYRELLKRSKELERTIAGLPKGYISNKTIKGKSYCYLQQRIFNKLTSQYIKADKIEIVMLQIMQRKEYEAELPFVTKRLDVLEQAALLISKKMGRELQRYKISSGMDDINSAQKSQCLYFASAMNAIEGIPISEEASQEITNWQEGEASFLDVLETTLKRYGFPVEV